MFDPTAFENMKVVIEGAVYDLDLSGEICVIDRNDLINLAKFSREFNISFIEADQSKKLLGKFFLKAKLENLAAELLPAVQSKNHSGCYVTVSFIAEHHPERQITRGILETVKAVWGTGREINQIVTYDTAAEDQNVKSETSVSFKRLILEEQIDDLAEMVSFMLLTLKRLAANIP